MRPPTRTLLFAARLVLGLGLLGATVLLVDFRELREAVSRIDPLMFVVATALTGAGTIMFPAIATRRMLAVSGVTIGFWQLIRINLAMRFYVLTLPHAVTVGIRWHRYNEQQGKGWEVAALIMFERTIQLAALAGFAFAFLILSGQRLPAGLHLVLPASIALFAISLAALFAFVSPVVFRIVDRPILAICRKLPRWLSRHIDRLRAVVLDYHRLGRRSLGIAVFCSLGWYACLVASGYAISQGLGAGLGVAEIGWMRSVVFLLTLLPVTAGGMGVREAGFAFLFGQLGFGGSTGLAFGLIIFAIQIAIGLTGLALEARGIWSDFRRVRNAQG